MVSLLKTARLLFFKELRDFYQTANVVVEERERVETERVFNYDHNSVCECACVFLCVRHGTRLRCKKNDQMSLLLCLVTFLSLPFVSATTLSDPL